MDAIPIPRRPLWPTYRRRLVDLPVLTALLGVLAIAGWPAAWRSILYVAGLLCIMSWEARHRRVPAYSLLVLTWAWLVLTYIIEPIAVGGLGEAMERVSAPAGVVVFTVAVGIGYASGVAGRIGATWPARVERWDDARLQYVCAVLLAISLGFWGLYMAAAGTTPLEMLRYSLAVRMRVEGEVPAARWLRDFGVWTLWAPFYLLLIHRATAPGAGVRLRRAPFVAAFMLAEAWMFIQGQRWLIFAPAVITVLLLAALGHLRLTWPRILLAGLAGMILSFLLVMYRTRSLIGGVDWGELLSAVGDLQLLETVQEGFRVTSSRMDKLQAVLDAVPSQLGFTWGDSYIGVILLLVPRRLFPWKPMYSDDYVQAALFPGLDYGLAFGGIAEAYLNFGWLGVVVMGLLAGEVLRVVDTTLVRWPAAPGVLFWFAQVWFLLPNLVVGGYFGVTMIQVVLFAILAWIVCGFLRSGVPATAS